MRDHDALQSSAPVPFTVFSHQDGERQHLLMLAHLMTMSGHTEPEGSHQLDSKRAVHSCRKNVPGTSFVSDLRDHMHEFINASADEHRTCFTKTIKKMFGMSKSDEAEEAGPASVLPLQTTVSL